MKPVSVRGLEGLYDQLKELGNTALGQKTLMKAARKAFKPVLASAQAKAPVALGILRDSIKIATAQPKAGDTVVAVGLTVVKNKNAGGDIRLDASWRWHFVERGTAKKGAQPFMRPALDENAEIVVQHLGDELRKGIKRVSRKRKSWWRKG